MAALFSAYYSNTHKSRTFFPERHDYNVSLYRSSTRKSVTRPYLLIKPMKLSEPKLPLQDFRDRSDCHTGQELKLEAEILDFCAGIETSSMCSLPGYKQRLFTFQPPRIDTFKKASKHMNTSSLLTGSKYCHRYLSFYTDMQPSLKTRCRSLHKFSSEISC